MINYFNSSCVFSSICLAFGAYTRKLVDQNNREVALQNGRMINPAKLTDKILNITIQANTTVGLMKILIRIL